ncbi:hypothetical protein GNI_138600 [Gregarina niphandrodes]|uniref:Uncharacterized protein n=1 Tax=Gregarina niphandrodes TaxID=110365 RepID=A0A023B0U2_GRENI|nr:hypothetical protein GNI_138600 [Gregarina niphandrodes]EZG45425.1 hypothetical protein GNI_138600 [Gregarina niphandrodes]|eukprot:XP_011132501.1 hypothetical protein GNI_138600 [Gregarina niphandrodes]
MGVFYRASSEPLNGEVFDELERRLEAAIQAIERESERENSEWLQLLQIFTDLKQQAEEDQHYEEAFEQTLSSILAFDEDQPQRKGGKTAAKRDCAADYVTEPLPQWGSSPKLGDRISSFSTLAGTTTSVFSDMVSFFSPTKQNAGTQARSCFSVQQPPFSEDAPEIVSALELTTTVKRQEQATVKFLNTQLSCAIETVRIKELLWALPPAFPAH